MWIHWRGNPKVLTLPKSFAFDLHFIFIYQKILLFFLRMESTIFCSIFSPGLTWAMNVDLKTIVAFLKQQKFPEVCVSRPTGAAAKTTLCVYQLKLTARFQGENKQRMLKNRRMSSWKCILLFLNSKTLILANQQALLFHKAMFVLKRSVEKLFFRTRKSKKMHLICDSRSINFAHCSAKEKLVIYGVKPNK